MNSRIPNEVIQTSATATYTGGWRLFWISVHATVAAVVTISDDTTELYRLSVEKDKHTHINFIPTLTVHTSLVITEVSGTAVISISKAGK